MPVFIDAKGAARKLVCLEKAIKDSPEAEGIVRDIDGVIASFNAYLPGLIEAERRTLEDVESEVDHSIESIFDSAEAYFSTIFRMLEIDKNEPESSKENQALVSSASLISKMLDSLNPNTEVWYSYADAEGFTYFEHSVVLEGRFGVLGLKRVYNTVDFNMIGKPAFIPGQVGLPDLQGKAFEKYDTSWGDCDHVFHELISVRRTLRAPTPDLNVSAREFAVTFEGIAKNKALSPYSNGWNIRHDAGGLNSSANTMGCQR